MSELNGNKTQSTQSSTKVKIPCRISYANIWEPKSINGSEAKYSVSCIFPKSNQELVNKVNAAIEAAKELGRDKKWGGKIPTGPNFKTPLRDGDIERPDQTQRKLRKLLTAEFSLLRIQWNVALAIIATSRLISTRSTLTATAASQQA